MAYALRGGLPPRRVIRKRFERLVAPGVEFRLGAAARGAFPFGFGWQTVAFERERAQPFAVCNRVEPRWGDNRLLRMGEIWIVPVERLAMAGSGQEFCVAGIGYLAGGEFEGVDPDAMGGAFVVLARLVGVAAHEEPAFGDANHWGFGTKVRNFGHRF